MHKLLFVFALAGSLASAQTTREDLERMALAVSPALQRSAAEVRAAAGRAKQAGLYPNPMLGATGDHNTPALDGGSLGGFAEQRIVTGGKLGLDRKVADQDRLGAEEIAKAERLRVIASIDALYYRGLGEQRLIEVRTRMAELTQRTAVTSHELANLGQADQPDVFQVEIEAQRAQLAVIMARNALDRTWREIQALLNQPGLKSSTLSGDLEPIDKLDPETALARILTESPELRIAAIAEARSGIGIRRAKASVIPDIVARGGVRYNRELHLDRIGGPLQQVGPEGYFDVGISIPIFDRNQGSIQAAEAEAHQARAGVELERQMVRSRFAAVYKEYADARAAIELYRENLLPKARQGFEMYQGNFRQMAAAYPKVLLAQRNLIQMEEEYIAQLVAAWQARVEIDSLLVAMPAGR
jgi:cobalt-zinc-cadmium efflux system outer membrane protein